MLRHLGRVVGRTGGSTGAHATVPRALAHALYTSLPGAAAGGLVPTCCVAGLVPVSARPTPPQSTRIVLRRQRRTDRNPDPPSFSGRGAGRLRQYKP